MPQVKNYCKEKKCTADNYGKQCACINSVVFGVRQCVFLKGPECTSVYATGENNAKPKR